MSTTADFLLPPLLAFVIAATLGVALALFRQRGRSAAWIGLDAVILLFAFLPLPVLAGLCLTIVPGIDRLVPWLLAAILTAAPLAYLPTHLALTRLARPYRDSARLLGLGPVRRLFRVDFPLAWKAIGLGKLLVLTRIAAEWLLVIGAFDRLNAFTAAIALLALASAIGVAVAIDRLRPLR